MLSTTRIHENHKPGHKTEKMSKLSDEEIIEGLKTQKNINKYIASLYQNNFRSIANFIKTNSGTRQDAEDIFQEAVCIFINMLRNEKYRGEASIRTVLYSISRNLWFQQLKKNHKKLTTEFQLNTLSADIDPGMEEEVNLAITGKEARKQLVAIFDRLGEVCKKILLLFYFEKLPMKQILPQLHYKSEQVLRNKKYLCWKHFKQMVNEGDNKGLKEIFKHLSS